MLFVKKIWNQSLIMSHFDCTIITWLKLFYFIPSFLYHALSCKACLLNEFVRSILNLKSLSNIQSFLKYSHVYLYLNHSNSLSNDTFLSWKVGVYVVENYVQMYISLALFKPNKKKYLYCNWRISKVSTSWSLCKNKNKTSLCCRGCRAMPSQKGDAQSKLKPRSEAN